MPKKYGVREKIGEKAKKGLGEYDDLTAQLLYNRGIKTKKEAESFLNPDFTEHLHDPLLLPDMEKAADRVLKAIERGERVAFWTDYDADGIPGGALMHDFFKKISYTNFTNYIPDRHTEGYGLNIDGIEKLKEEKVDLIITVDCGTRDHKYIDHANKLGIDVIVTDHHEPSSSSDKPVQNLPNAYAVVNPKRSDSKYPESVLCGTGVAWKLIEAILFKKRDLLGEGQEKWLLDLVGIATLSDMVPLTGENRALSHFGLSVLRKSRRPGLRKLFSMLRMNREHLTEDDIAFMITPRINAASRMGKPIDAFKLLTAKTEAEAEVYAKHLDSINNERKGVVAGIVKEAKKIIKEKFESLGEKKVIVAGNPDWRPSLLGLAANSIAEEYGRPVFLWGRAHSENSEGEEIFKGSCRSDGSTDLVSLMERASSHFLEFGGHKFSGGFSVGYENIHTLEDALIEASVHAAKNDEQVLTDIEIKLSEANEKIAEKISRLAPFGTGNEKPIFILRNIIPEKINRFGKAKEHLSINLRDGSSSARAISFFASPDQFGDNLKEGIETNLVANLEKSFYNGSSEVRLRIIDFF